MLTMYQQIVREVSKDALHYNDDEEMTEVIYFPKLKKAWVEVQGRKRWIDAAGINHALEQIEWNDDIELEMAQ